MTTRHSEGGLTAADGAAPAVHNQESPRARVPLSTERIVSTAIDFIETHGLAQLSMRKLGSELGVEAMSLYRYLPGREALLDAIVKRLVDQLYDDLGDSTADVSWQDFLQRLAHAVRTIALRQPKVFPLVASRPTEAPWLRPPLRSLSWVELFLSRLIKDGFSDTAALSAYRAYTSFLLGHLLLEVSGHGADIGPLDVLTPQDPTPGLAEYPQVCRLSAQLSEDHSQVEFEESLENLLDRLQLLL